MTTAGQVGAAIKALGDINTSACRPRGGASSECHRGLKDARRRLARRRWRRGSDLDADAVLAEDALGVIAVFFPQAAAIAALIALLVEVSPFLDLHLPTGDADPEVDANAYRGRGGRGN